MRKKIKKYILIFLGSLFVILGVIGALLPILPTTPFLLLALACFANSSPRFHKCLLDNRWFGSDLRQWEDNKSIARASKVKAMILIVITFAMSIAILHGRLQLQGGLICLGSILLVFMWRMKETEVIPITSMDKKQS